MPKKKRMVPHRTKAGRYRLRGDKYLKRKKRKCSNCGAEFRPTLQRRLLCINCFRGADG